MAVEKVSPERDGWLKFVKQKVVGNKKISLYMKD